MTRIYDKDFAKKLIELAGGQDSMEVGDDGVYLTEEWVEETEEIKADWSPQGALPGSDPGSRKLLPIPFSTSDLAAFVICPAAAGSELTDLCQEGRQPDPKKLRDAFTGAPGLRYADAVKEAAAHLARAYAAVGPEDHTLEELAQSLCEEYKTMRRAARERLGIAPVSGHGLSDEDYYKHINLVQDEVAAIKDKWDAARGRAEDESVRWLNAMVGQIFEHENSTEAAIASTSPSSVDYKMLATPDQLIYAFGFVSGMDASWFLNLKDSPGLRNARKITGRGGRSGYGFHPLFCPYEVMRWLINPKRKKGTQMSEIQGWKRLRQHFEAVYNAHSIESPLDD